MIAITLMTCHKGVDLHAASAAQIIRERLEGGERLVSLARAEFRSFEAESGRAESAGVAALLATGRCYNPNKHYFGHFRMPALGKSWRGPDSGGGTLSAEWPGEPVATDLGRPEGALRDRLLGGGPPAGVEVFDVCAFPLGQEGPLLSGVVWRLAIAPGDPAPEKVAESFVVARSAREGLLVNPHLERWLMARRAGAAGVRRDEVGG